MRWITLLLLTFQSVISSSSPLFSAFSPNVKNSRIGTFSSQDLSVSLRWVVWLYSSFHFPRQGQGWALLRCLWTHYLDDGAAHWCPTCLPRCTDFSDTITGLWLVEREHLTWNIASDWLSRITWPTYWLLIDQGLLFADTIPEYLGYCWRESYVFILGWWIWLDPMINNDNV